MSLTSYQKQLVTESFVRVALISTQAAQLFYARLWEINPETKHLFASTDMTEQGKKLMQTLAVAVNALDNLENVIPAIRQLGVRHKAYGVTKEHYDDVGQALLWALEQGLGSHFTPEAKDAWATVYDLLAGVATSVYDEIPT